MPATKETTIRVRATTRRRFDEYKRPPESDDAALNRLLRAARPPAAREGHGRAGVRCPSRP